MDSYRYKKIKSLFTGGIVFVLSLILMFFNNCSSEHYGETSSNALESLGTCSLSSEKQLFSLTYQPFLEKNCSTCHFPGGTGKGAFATSGLEVAWTAFSSIGFSKISAFAIDPSHQSPYTGPHNSEAVTELKELWAKGQEELVRCKDATAITEFIGDEYKDIRVHSVSRAISPNVGSDMILTWDLNKDMRTPPPGVNLPNMPGAFFEITVKIEVESTQTAYLISKPRIIYPSTNASATDINLESLNFRLNGEDVINETTFHYLKASARKNKNTLLSAGAMVAVGNLKSSDVISFSFGKIEATVLPPPPPKPSVEFITAQTNLATEAGTSACPLDDLGQPLVTNGEKCVNLTIRLSQAQNNFSSVGFSIETAGSTAKEPCCSTILDITDNSTEVKNFDRDYTIETNGSFTVRFDPQETEKTIAVRIVEDDRYEPGGETLKIQLNDLLIVDYGSGNIGNNGTHTIFIPDNDTAPGMFEVRFTDLMKKNGAFDRYCVRCHHRSSADVLAREYDMTTYDDLIDRGRVVPGNLDNSVVWRRILGLDGLDPMPQNGLLNLDGGDEAREDIRNWILNGAKNN